MQSDDRFIQVFTIPGSNWNIEQNLECLLEEYVCSLYREKKLSVNEDKIFGWNADTTKEWIQEAFPENITEF